MKTSGDDCNFTVDLGRDYQWQELSIDQVIVENKFINFYQSQRGEDFRDLSFQYTSGALIRTVNIRVDQYVDLGFTQNADGNLGQLIDRDSFSSYVEQKGGVRLNASSMGGKLIFVRPTRSNGAEITSFNPTGAGWKKLGFRLNIGHPLETFLTVPTIRSDSLYDFAGPPMVLISIDQVNGSGLITNNKGSHVFALENNVVFGERIVFSNTQKSTCNVIYSEQKQTMRYLNIRLLSCDQMPLETPADSQGVINNNDLELIMVLTCR